MGNARHPGPQSTLVDGQVNFRNSPGPLGINDRADPNRFAAAGDAPGPTGLTYAGPSRLHRVPRRPADVKSSTRMKRKPAAVSRSESRIDSPPSAGPQKEDPGQTISGTAVPVGVGTASVTRIPVPGTVGLYVELSPRNYPGKSTSALFIQDNTGKRVLRLDYGKNPKTGNVDYHWNQKGTFKDFGIQDHTTVGSAGEALYKGAKYLKWGGRVFLVAGVAMDAYSIVVAKKKWRQVVKVASGWAGAEAGCLLVGGEGAGGGTLVEPGGGTAVGALLGCAVGGIVGYAGFSWAAGQTYDYVEETFFEPLPETSARDESSR